MCVARICIHMLMLVEVQLHAHSGYEVEWDRFLCKLVDSGVSLRSPWEWTKRRFVSNEHFIKRGDSSGSQVE